jgi:nucleotide-binding universal stress UspA family protein
MAIVPITEGADVKTIVLGLDGSEGSARALGVARDLAGKLGARIVVAHVDERSAAKGDMAPAVADEDDLRAEIDRQVEELKAGGIDASVQTEVMVLGGPAQRIVDVAEQADADLIVVGTRGRSSIAGVLLGSVTIRLLHIAKRPVLAVPPAE